MSTSTANALTLVPERPARRPGSPELRTRAKANSTPAPTLAETLVEGVEPNALVSAAYLGNTAEMTNCVTALREAVRRVHDGDLTTVEATLTAQTVALNIMFARLAIQASQTKDVDYIDRFTRLALKTQARYCAVVETLRLLTRQGTRVASQADRAQRGRGRPTGDRDVLGLG